ncbi:MAG: hypothetical protein AB1634_18995, partial [Thermodesulfobacteriota bacterium]
QGGPGRRLGALAPFVLLGAAYLAWYGRAGYGAAGSQLYLLPAEDPAGFLAAAVGQRIPRLVTGLLANTVPELDPFGRWASWTPAGLNGLSWAVTGLGTLALLPLCLQHPVCRFLALAALATLLPLCASPPDGRHLLLPSVGTSYLLAAFAVRGLARGLDWWRQHRAGGAPGWPSPALLAGTVLAVGVVLVHGLHAPQAAWADIARYQRATQRLQRLPLEAAMPEGPAAERSRVLLLNSPGDLSSTYFGVIRAGLGHPWPGGLWPLSTVVAPHRLTVTGSHSLRLTVPAPGFLGTRWAARLFRRQRPLPPGTVIRRGALEVTIAGVAGVEVHAIEARIDKPLTDPDVWLLAWDGTRWQRITPPAPGETVVLTGS